MLSVQQRDLEKPQSGKKDFPSCEELPGMGGIRPLSLAGLKFQESKTTFKLFCVFPLWFAYLFLTAILWTQSIPAALLSMALAGMYLSSWMGYFRHELWHEYFPGINNPFFFKVISYCLFSDPKIYELAHTTHHRDLHTARDIEFFCEDYEQSHLRRRIHFIVELLLGNIAWEVTTMCRLTKTGHITVWRTVWSTGVRFALVYLYYRTADFIFPGAGISMLWVYGLTVWAGSLMTRHDQWIEHLGILSSSPLSERIYMIRNLPDTHWTNRLWNLFNHHDPRDHYFHHAYPQKNFREAGGLTLPDTAVRITIPQYLRFLVQYYKSV